MLGKINNWWNKQSDSTKILIIIGAISIVGIILRWRYVISAIAKGFNYYSG